MQHEGKKCIQVQQAFADGATLAELEQHIAYLRSLGAPGDARPRIGVNGDCEVTMMICAVLRRTLQVLHKCPKKEVERPGSGLRWLEFEGKSGMARNPLMRSGRCWMRRSLLQTVCPNCRTRRVRSTPACWKLKLPARTRHL